MKSLLSIAYWPNLHYFYYVLNSEAILLELYEHYQKQSFRNRTHILSANGPLALSIPVTKQHVKELTRDMRISYKESWQIKHWRAITSAYKNSPYFEHFESDFEIFYSTPYEFLWEFNLQQLQTVLKILKLSKDIILTEHYERDVQGFRDLRESIHPKIDPKTDPSILETLAKPYYQTFEAKFAFIPNLSILDLLFNKGLETQEYLKIKPH